MGVVNAWDSPHREALHQISNIQLSSKILLIMPESRAEESTLVEVKMPKREGWDAAMPHVITSACTTLGSSIRKRDVRFVRDEPTIRPIRYRSRNGLLF
jgi:hypothetical protein